MYTIIVNIVSGHGKGAKVWKEVERMVKGKNISYRVHFTKRKGQVKELLKDNRDPVIAIGGDGTFHEVANALIHTGIPLGLIRSGTGNDFATTMGIPKQIDAALVRIFKNEPRPIYVLLVNEEKVCLTVVGTGFDGKLSKEINGLALKSG